MDHHFEKASVHDLKGITDRSFNWRFALTTPKDIALKLIQATSLPGDPRTLEPMVPRLNDADYYRLACHLIFKCQRCGTCCTTGDPIKLRPEDLKRIAKHIKMPQNKAIRKLVIPLEGPGEEVFAFKKVRPCKFYYSKAGGCSIYEARPRSCRIFPFLGIYGHPDRVLIHPTCPGSVVAASEISKAIDEVKAELKEPVSDPLVVKAALRWFNDILDSIEG